MKFHDHCMLIGILYCCEKAPTLERAPIS